MACSFPSQPGHDTSRVRATRVRVHVSHAAVSASDDPFSGGDNPFSIYSLCSLVGTSVFTMSKSTGSPVVLSALHQAVGPNPRFARLNLPDPIEAIRFGWSKPRLTAVDMQPYLENLTRMYRCSIASGD
jgi:hypothetical protein